MLSHEDSDVEKTATRLRQRLRLGGTRRTGGHQQARQDHRAPVAAANPKPVKPKKRPDFAARLKRIYGDLVLPGDVVVEERESRPY